MATNGTRTTLALPTDLLEAVVVSRDAINATSRVLLQTPDGRLTADSVALGEQVRALAKTRLLSRRGVLSEQALARIERALLIALDLPGQT